MFLFFWVFEIFEIKKAAWEKNSEAADVYDGKRIAENEHNSLKEKRLPTPTYFANIQYISAVLCIIKRTIANYGVVICGK